MEHTVEKIVKIEKIIYKDEESPFCIAKGTVMCKVSKNRYRKTAEVIKIKGLIMNARKNDIIKIIAEKTYSSGYGTVYNIESYIRIEPGTLQDIKKYLTSFKGLGPKAVDLLLDRYGLDVLIKIQESISAFDGIRMKEDKKELIREEIISGKVFEEILFYLATRQLDTEWALPLFNRYGSSAFAVLDTTPHIAFLEGTIDFKTADSIGFQKEVPHDDINRIATVIYATLKNSTESKGNMYELRSDLRLLCHKMVNHYSNPYNGSPDFTEDNISAGLDHLRKRRLVVVDATLDVAQCIYLYDNYKYETGINENLIRILQGIKPLHISEDEVYSFMVENNETYKNISKIQEQAILSSITNPISVVTGGPGTGKTFTTNAIIHAIQGIKPNANIALAAPTGKAANRMSVVTSLEAQTIHRLIVKEQYYSDFELSPDYLILDEYSMADAELTFRLLKCLSSESKIIFVGDYNQLPSVGAGNILYDFIHSGIIPVVKLETVFRQKGDSSIISNALNVINHESGKINKLEFSTPKTKHQDFYLLHDNDSIKIQNLIVESVERLRVGYGYSLGQIQVLSPLKNNELGTEALNSLLQDAFNSKDKLLPSEICNTPLKEFRKNDKVIHTKNNYDLEVYNGETGVVKAIGFTPNKTLCVEFPNKTVWYPQEALDQLSHAYAITVHKSQGSEFPVVIIPIHDSLYFNLNKNLIYTAITRAKEKVIFVGDLSAIQEALDKIVPVRKSNLMTRLYKSVS